MILHWKNTSKKLLGLKIDIKFSFDEHIKSICKETNRKIKALTIAIRYIRILEKGKSHWIWFPVVNLIAAY